MRVSRAGLAAAVAAGLAGAAPANAAPAVQPADKAAHGSTFQGRKDVWVVLLRLRGDLYGRWKATGKWPDDAAANAALGAHASYWRQQLAGGRALMAGGMDGDYWDNAAIILFEAKDEAEAKAIVAADPAVKAYVFQAQVRPFGLLWMTDKWGR